MKRLRFYRIMYSLDVAFRAPHGHSLDNTGTPNIPKIAQHNRTPPPGWNGVIPLSTKD